MSLGKEPALLVGALERLLEDRAWADVSVGDIATQAGVSRPAVYQHFENKAALLLSATAGLLEALDGAFRPWLDAPGRPNREAIGATIDDLVRIARDHRPLLAAFYDATTTDAAARAALDATAATAAERLARHLERGQGDGWARPDLVLPESASITVWTIERAVEQLVLDAEPETRRRLASAITTWIDRSLYVPA